MLFPTKTETSSISLMYHFSNIAGTIWKDFVSKKYIYINQNSLHFIKNRDISPIHSEYQLHWSSIKAFRAYSFGRLLDSNQPNRITHQIIHQSAISIAESSLDICSYTRNVFDLAIKKLYLNGSFCLWQI